LNSEKRKKWEQADEAVCINFRTNSSISIVAIKDLDNKEEYLNLCTDTATRTVDFAIRYLETGTRVRVLELFEGEALARVSIQNHLNSYSSRDEELWIWHGFLQLLSEQAQTTYVNDSVTIVQSFNKVDSTFSVERFVNSLQHGTSNLYGMNGTLIQSRTYENGVLYGDFINYNPEGTMKEYHFIGMNCGDCPTESASTYFSIEYLPNSSLKRYEGSPIIEVIPESKKFSIHDSLKISLHLATPPNFNTSYEISELDYVPEHSLPFNYEGKKLLIPLSDNEDSIIEEYVKFDSPGDKVLYISYFLDDPEEDGVGFYSYYLDDIKVLNK
jgi:hypothetical protein